MEIIVLFNLYITIYKIVWLKSSKYDHELQKDMNREGCDLSTVLINTSKSCGLTRHGNIAISRNVSTDTVLREKYRILLARSENDLQHWLYVITDADQIEKEN
jgi:hypothetical protein